MYVRDVAGVSARRLNFESRAAFVGFSVTRLFCSVSVTQRKLSAFTLFEISLLSFNLHLKEGP